MEEEREKVRGRQADRQRHGERGRDTERDTHTGGREVRKRVQQEREERGRDVSRLLAPSRQTQLLSWVTAMQASRDRDLILPVSLRLSISGTAQLSPLLGLMGSSLPGAALPFPPGLPVNAKCSHSHLRSTPVLCCSPM